MKILRKALVVLTGAGAVAVIMISAMALTNPKEWPGFPDITGPSPAYVLDYDERDFGWRTGNLVPVTICFKVPAGTTLDAENLSVAGDLALMERRITTQNGAEGLVYIRVEMKLQSLVYMPKWSAEVNVSYREDGGKWQKLKVEQLEVYTSKTFDGRKRHPEDPRLEASQGLHAVWTFSLLALGLAGTVFSVGVIVRRPKAKKAVAVTPLHPWTEIDQAWRLMRAGDRNPQTLRTTCAALRFYFKAQSASIDDLNATGDPLSQQVAQVLEPLEQALWTGIGPDEQKLVELEHALDNIRPPRSSYPQVEDDSNIGRADGLTPSANS